MSDVDSDRIFDKLDKLDANVSAMNAKIDSHMARTDERLDNGQRKLDDHEMRLRAVEQAKWRAAGAAGSLGALAGGGTGSLLSWLLTRH